MTPKSDDDEDMSMEEILASIRKFVTDSPPESSKKSVYKGNLAESVVIPPAGHTISRGQGGVPYPQASTTSRQSYASAPGYEPHSADRSRQSTNQAFQGPSPQYEKDILELKSPVLPTRSSDQWGAPSSAQAPAQVRQEESIMTLTNPIDTKKGEKPSPFSSKISQVAQQEAGLSSSHAVAASVNSLSRLAQASKSALYKKTSNLADQRDITLDQLIQDMIRPMIKLWIDTHLPSLVEDMVAKEIKRITNHLK